MYVVTKGTRYKQTRNVTAREAKYPWAEMAAPIKVMVNGKEVEELSQFFVPNIKSKKIQGNAYQTAKKLTEKRKDGIVVKFALRNVIVEDERPVMVDKTNEDGTITQVIATNEDGTPKMEKFEIPGVLCQRVS